MPNAKPNTVIAAQAAIRVLVSDGRGVFMRGCYTINPATIYIVFRASRKCQIKAQLAANGYSIGKSCNAELTLS
jgi:hypothetical protein